MAAPRYGHGQSTQVLRLLHVHHWLLDQGLASLQLRHGSPRRSNEDETQALLRQGPTDGGGLARSTRCASCTSNVSGAAWHRNTPSCSVWDSRLPSSEMHIGDLAFREAARDEHFWTTEVDKKVLQNCTAQRTRNQFIDPGFGAIRYANQGGKRSRDDGSSDGPPPKRTRRKSKKERDQEARKAKGGERRKNSGGGGGGGGKGKGKGDAVSSAGKY